MPGLLDIPDDGGMSPLGIFAASLGAGTSPFFGVNMGNAFLGLDANLAAQSKMRRENSQAEMSQLVNSYKILKDQDAIDAEQAAFDNKPHVPNPALIQIGRKLNQLLGTPQSLMAQQPSQPVAMTGGPATSNVPGVTNTTGGLLSPPGSNSGGLLSGVDGASFGSPSPPMPQPTAQPQPQQPMQMPGQQQAYQATIRQAARAAGIPDAIAMAEIARGKGPELYAKIMDALKPQNGPAGITRLNPVTGQLEIVAGNAQPGQVPFARDPGTGQLVAQPIRGAAEEVARAEGLKTDATEAAKARYATTPVTLPDGRTTYLTQADLARRASQSPQPGDVIPPEVQAQRDAQRLQILLDERASLAKRGQTDPYLEREIQLAQRPSTPGFVAGQSTAGKVAAEVNPRLQLETLAKGYDAANDANANLAYIDVARKALNGATATGLFARPELLAARVGSAFGISDPKAVSDPEVFMAAAAKQVMGSIKQLGSGSGISDSDREYAARALGGDIKLNKDSINRLLDIQEKANRRVIDLHNQRAQQASDSGVPGVFDYRVTPQTTGRTAVAGPLVRNMTATYRAQQAIQQGKPRDLVIQRMRDQGFDPEGL